MVSRQTRASSRGNLTGKDRAFLESAHCPLFWLPVLDSGASEVAAFVVKETEDRIDESIKKMSPDNKIKDQNSMMEYKNEEK